MSFIRRIETHWMPLSNGNVAICSTLMWLRSSMMWKWKKKWISRGKSHITTWNYYSRISSKISLFTLVFFSFETIDSKTGKDQFYRIVNVPGHLRFHDFHKKQNQFLERLMKTTENCLNANDNTEFHCLNFSLFRRIRRRSTNLRGPVSIWIIL